MDFKAPSFLYDYKIYERSKNYVVFDTETTTIDFGTAINPDNELILACWRVVKGDTYEDKWHFGSEYEMQELLDDIAKADFVVAQNAKFDLGWLRRCGADLRKILPCDTMLAEWVLLGNRRDEKHLVNLAAKYGAPSKKDLVSAMIKSGCDTRLIGKKLMLEYCLQDVDTTHKVWLKQLEKLIEYNLLHLFHVRNLTCACITDMEFNPMMLDPERVRAEYNKTLEQLEECRLTLDRLTGGINLNSPKQLSAFLYDTMGFSPPKDHKGKPIKTAGGDLSTNAAVLSKLEPETEDQGLFLRTYKLYNKLDSLLTKNLEFFEGVCDEYDCQFNVVINQGVTATHRTSSSGRPLLFRGKKKSKSVQGQNLPREYKKLFWSGHPDYLVGEADGAQLEFRVAAEMGQDETAIREILNGEDVHAVTAQVLLEHGQEGFADMAPKDRRQASKSRTFRPLYGGTKGSPAEEAYCKFFAQKYTGIAQTQRGWALKVADKKFFTTPYGMRFYWPHAEIQKSGYISYSTEIYNYPIQGFATAEIIPIALVHFWYRVEGHDITMRLTIHDSIVSTLHKDEQEFFEEASYLALTKDVYKFLDAVYNYSFSKVPLGAGVKIATHWSDTKREVIYNVLPTGETTKKIEGE